MQVRFCVPNHVLNSRPAFILLIKILISKSRIEDLILLILGQISKSKSIFLFLINALNGSPGELGFQKFIADPMACLCFSHLFGIRAMDSEGCSLSWQPEHFGNVVLVLCESGLEFFEMDWDISWLASDRHRDLFHEFCFPVRITWKECSFVWKSD
jgi:hypothetical protein